VYIDNGTPVITFHQNQDIRRISRFNVALFTTKTVNTKTVLSEIPEDVYFSYFTNPFVRENETLRIFERNQIHICKHVCRPSKTNYDHPITDNNLCVTSSSKIITLLHCGMIITGTVKNEFTVSQYCIIKDYG
jgi:adenylate cyclase class IV